MPWYMPRLARLTLKKNADVLGQQHRLIKDQLAARDPQAAVDTPKHIPPRTDKKVLFGFRPGFKDHEIENRMQDWSERIHPGDALAVKNKTRDYLKGLIPDYEHESRMLHKDGSVRWFLTRGSAIYKLGSIINFL